MFLPGLDLNSDRSFCHPAGNLSAGGSDAHRETGLCSVDGTFAAHDLSSKCGALPWSSQSSALQLLGSISVDGLCAIDVPRESCEQALADKVKHDCPVGAEESTKTENESKHSADRISEVLPRAAIYAGASNGYHRHRPLWR